jgi:arabinose-5-phosphate isomerase
MKTVLKTANNLFDIEIEGLRQVQAQLNENFETLVQKCVETLQSGGKLVLTGVGKSGHIGKKIAATLSSTGSTAIFMHPVEALHGDLGVLASGDLLITMSYSGETEELLRILPAARRLGASIASLTGDDQSSLARLSDLVVMMKIEKEACPFNLAPTTSSTALLVLGDALAITLLKVQGFTKEDYGMHHPGGAIGRAVTMLISDVMRTNERLALVTPTTSVKETLLAMTGARSGSAIIIDKEYSLLGFFADSDLRRHIKDDLSILNKEIKEIMTKDPISIFDDQLAVDAMSIIEKHHVDDIIVINREQKVVGLIDVQDLPGLKLM